MTHREVRMSLSGILAGVLIGTGVLAYVQHATLAANVSTSPEYTRRAITDKGIRLRTDSTIHLFPTLKKESNSSAAVVTEGPLTHCSAVQKTVMKIQTVYNAVVPDTYRNTDIRQKMDAVLADAADDYCDAVAAPAAVQASSVASVKTDNHCEKYPQHTIRYTQCVLANENAKTYP